MTKRIKIGSISLLAVLFISVVVPFIVQEAYAPEWGPSTARFRQRDWNSNSQQCLKAPSTTLEYISERIRWHNDPSQGELCQILFFWVFNATDINDRILRIDWRMQGSGAQSNASMIFVMDGTFDESVDASFPNNNNNVFPAGSLLQFVVGKDLFGQVTEDYTISFTPSSETVTLFVVANDNRGDSFNPPNQTYDIQIQSIAIRDSSNLEELYSFTFDSSNAINIDDNGSEGGHGFVAGTVNLFEPQQDAQITIENFDFGNYVIAGNGKFYTFRADIIRNSSIQDFTFWFTDGFNNITVSYNNLTNRATLDSGSTVVTLGTHTRSESSFNSTLELYTLIVSFPILFKPTILDAANVDIVLFVNASSIDFGPSQVRTNYFNILNKGGATETLRAGPECDVDGGAVFELCQRSVGWVARNATFYKLQNYHTQFAISFTRNDTGAREDQYMQDEGHAEGVELFSDPRNWELEIGWFYWDPVEEDWVRGWNLLMYFDSGDQGVDDHWTNNVIEWYRKGVLVKNETIMSFIEDEPKAQTRLILDLWFNKINASSVHGGRINAFYYGIDASVSFGFWQTWAPLLFNQTTTTYFNTNLDFNDAAISAQQLELSKIYWNLSRATDPDHFAGNFTIYTGQFTSEDFKTTRGTMAGVDTPIPIEPKVPDLPPTGFLAMLWSAILRVGDLVVTAFGIAAELAFQALASQFPWFAQFFTDTYEMAVAFSALATQIWAYLSDLLSFLLTIFSLVATPITIVHEAWITLHDLYLGIFGPEFIGQAVQLTIIVVFWMGIVRALEEEDWNWFLLMARITWGVTNAILSWTFRIVKFIVDLVTGLIPL